MFLDVANLNLSVKAVECYVELCQQIISAVLVKYFLVISKDLTSFLAVDVAVVPNLSVDQAYKIQNFVMGA